MPSSPGPGQQLGRYRLTKELGRGAMGQVFLAEDSILGQPVCLKILHPQYLHHPEAVARFSREIVLARRIAHHGICRVYDLHEQDGHRFLTMEYVEGAPVKDLIGTRISVERALRLTQHICEALAAAHDKGVIHRDLKPGNIMVRAGTDDDICILDFGIAAADDTAAQGLTRPGVALGTRLYIAPEVWAGASATPRSDLFAIGVILFRLLTGQMPWGTEDLGVFERMRTEPPRRASSLRSDVPADVDALLARALAATPETRIESAQAFARACAAAVAAGARGPREVATRVERPAHLIVDPTASSPSERPLSASPLPASSSRPSSGASPASSRSGAPPASSSPPPSFAAQPTLVSPRPVSLDPHTRSITDPVPDQTVDADHFHQDRTDQVKAIHSDEASWVISGRAVDAPVRPKVMQVVAPAIPTTLSGTEIVQRPRRSRGPAVALVAVASLALGAVAVAVFWQAPASGTHVDGGPMETVPPATETVPPATETVPPATETVPPVPDTATPIPETLPDAGPSPGTVPETVPPVPETVPPVPETVPPPPETGPVPDAGVADVADVAPTRPAPPVRGGGGARVAAQQAVKDITAAMRARGLVPGDDAELDRLKKAASRALKARRHETAVDSADAAIARVAAVRIDRSLVERKLTRFNTLFDREKNEAKRARLDEIAGRASLDFAGGRLDAANRALNEGFAILGKDR